MKYWIFALVFLSFFCDKPVIAQKEINISLHAGTEAEQKAKKQLEEILQQYDLTRWIFTQEVVIQSKVIPHSHPVLTLNTRYLGNNEGQLASFLHEQIHWFVDTDSVSTHNVIQEFRRMYPEVPVRGGEGARSEYSTYLHLMVCWLEFDALRQLVGEEKARKMLADNSFYRWIYKQVLEDGEKLEAIIRKQGMLIK